MTVRIAIVHHSGYGHTAAIAKSVLEGAAAAPGTEARLFKVEDFPSPSEGPWDWLASADAIIFGAPTYMGSVSAPMKQFMDLTSRQFALGAWKNKVAAGFTNSAAWSGDKLASLVAFAVFAAQHGMVWVPLGLPPGFNSSLGKIDDLNRVGSFIGLMTQANADQSAEVAPPQADHKTAEHFGLTVATAAARWQRGQS